MAMKQYCMALLAALVMATAVSAQPTAIDQFLKRDQFRSMKISPDGKHLAALVPQGDDQTVLVILEREGMRPISVLGLRGKEHVDRYYWVNDNRVVASATKKEGMLDSPVPTGELFGASADGKAASTLFGYRLAQAGSRASNIRQPEAERASAFLLDTTPDNERQVLIRVVPWMTTESGNFSELRRMDAGTGRTTRLVTSPIPLAEFLVDHQGNTVISWGNLGNNVQQVFRRPLARGEWVKIHDEAETGTRMYPVAFSGDGSQLYVIRDSNERPDALYRIDMASMESVLLVSDPRFDVETVLFGPDRNPYAALLLADRPRLVMLDEDSRQARLATALGNAFPGQFARFTSFTKDGELGVVHVYSDRNPGEYYLFELATMRASFLGSTRDWIDPDTMAQMQPIQFQARDGQRIDGYLTVPHGKEASALPMVVNPHGGPHGVRDIWAFDEDAQLLASRGYAVLRVNFRGSGGYGRAFEQAGYRQWGGLMQDDVADAVRWAVAQGHADPERVCIYGGSYGGYTALMNAGRYPSLYRCVIGEAGVYDLRLMYNEGDIKTTLYGRTYLDTVLGNENLGAASPIAHAAHITMPVMLIHGGEDERVPQTHADRMRDALRQAGNDPEWLLERREGHGFFNQETRLRKYERLLAFLDRAIGERRSASAEGTAEP